MSAPVLRLRRWTDPAVLGLALVAFATGFGQFGAVASLGDVARTFGHHEGGLSLTDQAGLSGTQLGLGLAVARLASLAALPLTGAADRWGRRVTLLLTCAGGLALTVLAAASPGYWWFVAAFALGRPLLSTAGALAQVGAAEQTGAADRTRAVALIAGGYAAGSGTTALLHSLAGGTLGFRGVFALAAVPLLLLPLAARSTRESDRFRETAGDAPLPVLGAVEPPHRRRLLVLAGITFAVAVVSGPANSFFFLYVQNVLHIGGGATALLVVGAGVCGLGGLVAGQWMADRLGRRPTGALGLVAVIAFGTLAYSGSRDAGAIGYLLGVTGGAVFAPAAGALATEVFPTRVRASAAGWAVAAGVLGAVVGLLAFGAIADVGNRFGTGAAVTFLPMLAATGLFWLLPETKGREPEDVPAD
jgi:AAHS family benzoate transporter-like MFS transporter